MKKIESLLFNSFPKNRGACAMLRTSYLVLRWPILISCILALSIFVKYSSVFIVSLMYLCVFYTNKYDLCRFDRVLLKVMPFLVFIATIGSAFLLHHIEASHVVKSGYMNNFSTNVLIAFSFPVTVSISIVLTWIALYSYDNPIKSLFVAATTFTGCWMLQYPFGCMAAITSIALLWLTLSNNFRWPAFLILAVSSPVSIPIYQNISLHNEQSSNIWLMNTAVCFTLVFTSIIIGFITYVTPSVLNWVRSKYNDSLDICAGR